MIKLSGDRRKAIQVSNWLKENGLKYEQDYTWHYVSDTGEFVFHFRDELNESLIAMRFSHE